MYNDNIKYTNLLGLVSFKYEDEDDIHEFNLWLVDNNLYEKWGQAAEIINLLKACLIREWNDNRYQLLLKERDNFYKLDKLLRDEILKWIAER